MTNPPEPDPRTEPDTPERDYDPPAVEDLREDYPLATAAGQGTIK